ncbi:MAG: hypothetical protein ACR652_02230 [Methylocystis sp.]|uniref:hypothetical protein n=1 Tax=Methylocystis sp. TaxID=1911079 RepID=UPI003DA2D32D
MTMRDAVSEPEWCLAEAAVLVCIAASRFGAPLPLSFTMTLVELWRSRNWPVVHFLPDPALDQDAPAETALIQPGSLWFESDTASIWSCARFREYHRDQGSPPLVLIGGDLDRSMIAVAAGAAERRTPAVFLPDTAGVTLKSTRDRVSRERAISCVRHFAVEASLHVLMTQLVSTRRTLRR